MSDQAWRDFIVIRDRCVKHSGEAPTTAADVSKFAVRSLNSLNERQWLLTGVDEGHSTNCSSAVEIQPLKRRLLSDPALLQSTVAKFAGLRRLSRRFPSIVHISDGFHLRRGQE